MLPQALLHVTVVYFDNRIRHLTTIIDSIMKDVNNEKEPFSAGGWSGGFTGSWGVLRHPLTVAGRGGWGLHP
jgi:hypothetical protein